MSASPDAWISGTSYTHTTTLDIADGEFDHAIKRITIRRVNDVPTNFAMTWRNDVTKEGRLFPNTLGSNDDILQLFPDEEIISARVYQAADNSIHGLSFETSSGRFSSSWGSTGNKVTILSGYLNNAAGPPIRRAQVVKGLQLRHNADSSKLVGIRFFWRDSTVHDAPNIWVGARAGPVVGYQYPQFLGFGNPLNKRLSKVEVWSTKDTGYAVHGFRLSWEDTTKPGSKLTSVLFGASSNRAITLDLQSGDQIVSLYVRHSGNIDMIIAIVKKADGSFDEKRLGGLPDEQPGDNNRTPLILEPPSPDMSLLGIRAFATDPNVRPNAFEPIWVANPPIGYEIVIDRIIWDESHMTTSTGQPSSTSAGATTNATADPITTTIAYEYTTTKSSRFQLDRSITTTVGVEVSAEVSVSAGTGFVSGTATAGFSAFSEISGTFSHSKELAKEETVTHQFSEEVTVPAQKQLEHNAIFKKVECRGLEWIGRIFVRYANGARHEAGPIGGTFSGTDNSVLLTSYTISDAGATLPEPVYAEFRDED